MGNRNKKNMQLLRKIKKVNNFSHKNNVKRRSNNRNKVLKKNRKKKADKYL